MKFRELCIEKYGSCQSLRLQFPASPGLVVIYGPNEAGKSTCLSAISDLLFGIPKQSLHGQLFGNELMRISATMERSSGELLTLRRRKGQSKTLTDETGKLVDEQRLAALLGSTDRAKFAALFGLNHESLREGGKRLLTAEGDIGRLIVEAGGGLRALVDKLSTLDRQASQLFAPRKSADRAFYQSLAAFESAERAVREGLRTREDYEQANSEYESAKRALAQCKQAQRELRERKLEQERLIRIVPMLAELDRSEEVLATFAALPSLRPAFVQEVRSALSVHKQATQSFHEAETQRSSLARKVEGLIVPPEWTTAEAQIRDITEKAKGIARQRVDRSNRERELATSEAKLAPLCQRIGVSVHTDLEPLMPSEIVRNQVQQLLAQGSELRPIIAGLESQISDDMAEISRLEQEQQNRTTAGQHQPFGVTASEFDSLPQQAATQQTKRAQAERMDQAIAQQVVALGFSQVSELRALNCPDEAIIQGERDARAELETERLRQAAIVTAERIKKDSALREIARLRQGEEVPTEDAICAARSERAAAWRPVKQVYLAEDAQTILSLSLVERHRAVDVLEKQTHSADALADRKSTEAHRIAALAVAETQRDEAQAAMVSATQAGEALENKVALAVQRWKETWTAATDLEADLGRLKELARKRKDLLEAVSRAEGVKTECELMQAELSARLVSLTMAEQQLGLSADPQTSLSARVRSVHQRIAAHEESYRSHREAANQLSIRRSQLTKRRAQLDARLQAEAAWQTEWTLAARQLGLADQVSIAHGQELVTAWAAADGVFDSIRNTRRRLARMDEDETALRQMLDDLAPSLGLTLPDDPVAAAHMVEEKWKAVAKLDGERNALRPQLDQRTHERDVRKHELDEAAHTLHMLRTEAQCELADLDAVASRYEQWAAAQDRHHQLAERVFSTGDGHAAAFYREQLGGRSLDELRAALQELEGDTQRLDQQMEEAAVRVSASLANLSQLQTEQVYNHAVASREQSAAELHQIVERYLDMRLAHTLLTGGIAFVRDQQQDPLIKRAGELFALTTEGMFVGVEADVDDKGNPVLVGKRRDDTSVAIDTMSDGTRDQLFLSFRLAHIEQYCVSAEPLPFVADDLLVHFDDARSSATLKLLSELGKTTQVLLFTHHHSIKETAQQLTALHHASFIDLRDSSLKAA